MRGEGRKYPFGGRRPPVREGGGGGGGRPARRRKAFAWVEYVYLPSKIIDALLDESGAVWRTAVMLQLITSTCRATWPRKIRAAERERFNLSTKTYGRSIRRLQEIGLVTLEHMTGRSPHVRLVKDAGWATRVEAPRVRFTPRNEVQDG